MKVKITPTGESAQVMEFNVSLPGGANASVAPVSTLTVTQRWAKVVNVDLLGNAAKAEMKDKYPDGYVTNIFGKPVKFNDEDITQLLNLFKQNK